MTTAYSPTHFMEALARERRHNRRPLAYGRPAKATITARQRIVRVIVQLRRRRGDFSEAMPGTNAA